MYGCTCTMSHVHYVHTCIQTYMYIFYKYILQNHMYSTCIYMYIHVCMCRIYTVHYKCWYDLQAGHTPMSRACSLGCTHSLAALLHHEANVSSLPPSSNTHTLTHSEVHVYVHTCCNSYITLLGMHELHG